MCKTKTMMVSLVLVVSVLVGSVKAEVIYYEDFSAGLPGAAQGWTYYNNWGWEEVSIFVWPGYGLVMQSGPGEFLNEAIFAVDLTGYAEALISVWYSTDEYEMPQPLPTSFSGHYNGDGVSWSFDGYNWTALPDSFYPTPSFDSHALITSLIPTGFPLFIKIQQFGGDEYGQGTISIPLITIEGYSYGIVVPNVVGMTQSSAATAIFSADLTVGTITYLYSSTVAAGNVISQTPSAGAYAPSGSSVNLAVSQGPAPTGSLQVTLSPAEAILAGAQWRRMGTTQWFDSGTTESDIATGSYMVEFKAAIGWQEPLNLSVVIDTDQLTDILAEYTPSDDYFVTIGAGTAEWRYPLATYYHDARTQTIYRAGEVGGACIISGLSLYVTQTPGQTLNTFTIRLKHTDLDDYSTFAQWDADDWTVVYQADQTISATGWVKFAFTDMFFFDGDQNVMVDISFNNSSYTFDGFCRYSTLGGLRSLFYRTDSEFGNDPLAWFGTWPSPNVSNNAPNIRLYLEDIGTLVTVPDMVGLTQTQAEDLLQSVSLGLGVITYGYSNAVEAGLIYSQAPAAGSILPEGFGVGVYMSLGPIYSGGSGTGADPYQIANADDLLHLAGRTEDYARHFILTADIDLAEEVFAAAVIAPDTDSGAWWFQGDAFFGVFDGDDFTISNLTVAAASNRDYIGLFGHIGAGARVKNVKLENVNIEGRSYVGGLVGMNSGTLTDCDVTGSVSGGNHIGGLCGYNSQGTISNSFAAVEITGAGSLGGLVGHNGYGLLSRCYATGNVSGTTGQYSNSIGGLCGYNYEGIISDSYATGSVSGNYYIGGLCGYSFKDYAQQGDIAISRSYATGEVSESGWAVGGLVGYSGSDEETWDCHWMCHEICDEYDCWEECWEDCWPIPNPYEAPWLVSSSFWDMQTTGQTVSSGGIGKYTSDMQTQSTFAAWGWDFAETWSICETTNYPRLRWQIPLADFVCPDGVDLADFAHLASWWLAADCALHNDCGGTDIDQSGDVGLVELWILAEQWLR